MADKYSRFLERIAQLESSGGANLDHSPASKGVNKGASAVGRYGIMPQTALEVLRRVGDKGAEMTPEEVSQKLAADPMFEEKIARALAARVIEQHGGNEEKAAFSWLMGHNLDSSQISDEDLEKSDYVKKFKETKIPSDVDYRDEPQVNPPRQEKGLLERARDAASGVMDKISALPDEAQRQNNAMVAAVLTKADPSLSREQALEKAARMSDLASQAGMMSGSIQDLGRAKTRDAIASLIKNRGEIGSHLPAVSDELKHVDDAFASRNTGVIGHPETIARAEKNFAEEGTKFGEIALPANPARMSKTPAREIAKVADDVSYETIPWDNAPKHDVGEAMERLSRIQALRRIKAQ